ncbi:MAG: NmrA family NAD(P)-binding protein [Mycetocola sp.]
MSILVIGATGRLGPHIVRALDDAGAPVTALVRDRDKAAAVLPAGAHLVPGDFRAGGEQLDQLLSSVEELVLLTPHGPDMAAVQLALVDAAARRGVRVVKISGTGPLIGPDGPDACQQHWQVETALQKASGRSVVVRPNAFMQGLVAGAIAEARATGAVADPIGGAAINAVDCRDIAAVVAGVAGNQSYDGAVLSVTGPRPVTYPDLAVLINAAGIPAAPAVGSPTQSADRVRALGMSEWEARHLEEMLRRFADGAADFTTTTVAGVTGHPPRTVEDFVAHHLQVSAATG